MDKEPIKIKNPVKTKLKERAHTKYNLGVDRYTKFKDPIIQLNDEQAEKYKKFRDYCHKINKCVNNCKGYIDMKNFNANDDNDIVMLCTECLQYTIDSSILAREYVIWFNKILKDYGMSFNEDGFPKLMKHEVKGAYCANCAAHHTTMEFF